MSTVSINTLTDAQVFVDNSGVAEWDFGGNSSVEGFAEWLFRNRAVVDADDYDSDVAEYLGSVGENPKDYGFCR